MSKVLDQIWAMTPYLKPLWATAGRFRASLARSAWTKCSTMWGAERWDDTRQSPGYLGQSHSIQSKGGELLSKIWDAAFYMSEFPLFNFFLWSSCHICLFHCNFTGHCETMKWPKRGGTTGRLRNSLAWQGVHVKSAWPDLSNDSISETIMSYCREV